MRLTLYAHQQHNMGIPQQARMGTPPHRIDCQEIPSYLSASLCTYQTPRTHRSSNKKLLKIPERHLKSVGERSFSFVAPCVWNIAACRSARSPRSFMSLKPSSEIASLDRPFHRPRQTIPVTIECLSVYMHILCVSGMCKCIKFLFCKTICALLSIRAIHQYYYCMAK